jgi:hypothetical protein
MTLVASTMDSNTSRDPPAWVSCVERIVADSDIRPGVNSVCESRRTHYSNGAVPAVLRGPLLEAIERERARLMTADSLLGCIAIAMQGADGETGRSPYFPDLVELARELVNEAINGLDTAQLNRALSGGAARMRGRRARGSSISVA